MVNVRRFLNIKTLLFLGLLLIIFLLVVLARQLRPKPEDTPRFGAIETPKIQPVDQIKQPTSQTTNFPEGPLPKEARVYRQNPYALSPDQMNAIANNLGFSQGTLQGKLFFSQDQETKRYLGIIPQTGNIFVSQPLPDYLKTFNDEQLKDYAITLAKPTLLEERIWESPILTSSYFKGKGAHDAAPALPEDADFAEVNIFPVLDGTRLIGRNLKPLGDVGLVTVQYFKKDQEIVALRSSVIAVNFTEVGTYPLNPLESVTQELVQNQAIVTNVVPEGRTVKDIQYGEILLPTTAEYTDIELVYYYDPNPDAVMQPMYLVSGKAVLEDGTPATIKAILPAIDPQYLQSP